MDLWARWPIDRRATHGPSAGIREGGLSFAFGQSRRLGRIRLREPKGEADTTERMVRATRAKIFALEHVDFAPGETDRVRRACKLEIDVRKLFGVLSLPRRPSAVAKSFALRLSGKRFTR